MPWNLKRSYATQHAEGSAFLSWEELENEDDDRSAFPISNEGVIIIPQVQSMPDYIMRHYRNAIFRALSSQQSREDELQTGRGFYIEDGTYVFERTDLIEDTFRIREMTFWRESAYTVLARLHISVDAVEITAEAERIDRRSYVGELLIDMLDGVVLKKTRFVQEGSLLDQGPPDTMWKLSDYLVPILRKDEIEKGAEEILWSRMPAVMSDLKKNNAFELARWMGLEVLRLPLYKRSNTKSLLFFCDGHIMVEEDDGEETDRNPSAKKKGRSISVPANTIVINTNTVHKDACQLEVFHEFIHYEWHYMFYKLQDMHNNDIRSLKVRKIQRKKERRAENPLRWMEWQARRGSFGLMMPLSVFTPIVQEQIAKYSPGAKHMGIVMERVIRDIAEGYDIAKFRVRARLIQMGVTAAKGALNYVDGRYIDPFAFSTDNCRGDYSFVATRRQVYEEYRRNPEFAVRIASGEYVYADGHVCINSSEYVRQTSQGARLTAWANAHIDECCLRFVSVYEQTDVAEYCFGVLNSDEDYNNHYLEFTFNEPGASRKEQIHSMMQIKAELPRSFHGALTYLMRIQKMTIENMASVTQFSERTISRLRTEEKNEYALEQVLIICLVLHLPPWLSNEMLKHAGLILRDTELHQAYRVILDCMFMDTLKEVQDFLKECGQPSLKMKEQEELTA